MHTSFCISQFKKATSVALYVLLLILSLFTYAGDVLGATETFTLEQLIGGDSTPPTVPGNLTATPVASTQIDLSWDPSTDDVLMGGYQVWRDDAFIATTTGTTYSDAGLTASTTYMYYVRAFDAAFNYSASSSPITTATPPVSVSPPDSGGGSRIHPFPDQITLLEIVPQKDSVIIRFTTESHIRSVVRWGRTSSYELGSLAESTFSLTHETRITGLTPGVRYYFSIEGENRNERSGVMHAGDFMTLPPDDVFPPGNVRNLTAIVDGDDAVLSWVNPSDLDFSKVRIIRSDQFYPSDPADGWLVYEGDGDAFRDTGILRDDRAQYYTVFTYDALGNISSGATILVAREGEAEPVIDPALNSISLRFDEILFAQDGIVIPAREGGVTIDGTKQLTISIPYERLPEHLKTILVIIEEGGESTKSFKFLLRVDRDKHFYTGTLAPFGTSGTFPIVVSVFDYKTSQVGYTNGTIASKVETRYTPPIGFLEYFGTLGLGLWYTLLFVILLAALMILGHRALGRDA